MQEGQAAEILRTLPRPNRDGAELAAELDEQRLEGERRAEVELLEGPPGLAHELAGPLRPGEPLRRAVLGEDGEPVGMDDGALGADGDDDEVAVPGGELLERGEQLVALGAARCAPDALLGLARRQVERLELLLGCRLRLGGTLARAVEQPLRGIARLELRIGVDGARDLEQRLASPRADSGSSKRAARSRRPAASRASDGGLVRREPRRARVDLLADRALGQARERERAGSASGSCPAAGPRSSATRTMTAYGGGSSRSLSSASAASSFIVSAACTR